MASSKVLLESGAPGETRTPDLLVRSQPLYPTELRARFLIITAPGGAPQPRPQWYPVPDTSCSRRRLSDERMGLRPDPSLRRARAAFLFHDQEEAARRRCR